jgi:hypothetical protein
MHIDSCHNFQVKQAIVTAVMTLQKKLERQKQGHFKKDQDFHSLFFYYMLQDMNQKPFTHSYTKYKFKKTYTLTIKNTINLVIL